MSVPQRFGVGRIALRQLRSRPALALAQGLTLAAAGTLLASVVLIQNTTTADGLRSAVVAAGQGANVVIERDGIADVGAFDSFQRDAGVRVRGELGAAVVAGAQYGRSGVQTLRVIDGAAQGDPLLNISSLSYYAGLREHVRLVSGQWPADARNGSDWLITGSARATDTLGTPLSFRVGSEYCFNPRLFNGRSRTTWCGRMAATWLPRDASDPYWAGHVPETDALIGHDSLFQLMQGFPGAPISAVQEYVPNPGQISATDTGHIVAGVNQLRGFYGVSSNDVFIAGIDTALTGFLARQNAASGPTLVTTFGLLVVAVAAMGFAALQFIRGHAAQAALWRARGWSRARVWSLYTAEFAVLTVLAAPVAIVASAAVRSAVAGSSVAPALTLQSLADASVPAVIAGAAFLVILAGIAGVRSGPGLAQRPSDRSATSARSLRRRAIDVVLAVAGAGILLFVRYGGANVAGNGQSNGVVLALPVLAVGLLAFASLRLVGLAARVLTIRRSLSGRLARWQVERDPAQYARLCLLLTLAVAVGVFASTYTASDRASAIDRADYLVGADMRATFSSAASPPQLGALAASLPSGVRAAQVLRSAGRPGRSGTDSTIIGIQGTAFWDIAYSRTDFASRPLASMTSQMASVDPDGTPVPGRPRALSISVYSSGFDGRVDLEITDATGRDVLLTLGTLGSAGWTDMTAPLSTASGPVTFPVRVRSVRVVPTGSRAVGDVAVQNLRTDSGVVIESFTTTDGWWQEAFAPYTAEGGLKPSTAHINGGLPSVDVPIDLQAILLLPPPSSRPLPVLIASQTMASLGVSIGQPFPLHMDTVDVQLVPIGTFDNFPTYYPAREDLIVPPLTSLLDRLGHEGATSPWANELWLSVPASSAATVSAKINADSTLLNNSLRTDAERSALDDPLRVGLHDELGLGFIVALVVVVIGFGLHFLAAARSRVTHFAIMRANGVPQSVLRRSLVAEQVVVLISGLIAGTAVGLALAWAVVPIFNLGSLPEDVTPASVYHLDPLTLIAVVLGTGVLALVMGRLVAGSGSRVDVMSTVRSLA